MPVGLLPGTTRAEQKFKEEKAKNIRGLVTGTSPHPKERPFDWGYFGKKVSRGFKKFQRIAPLIPAAMSGKYINMHKPGAKNLKVITRRENIRPDGLVLVDVGGSVYEAVPGKRTRLKSKEEINKLKETNKSIKKSLEDAISRL